MRAIRSRYAAMKDFMLQKLLPTLTRDSGLASMYHEFLISMEAHIANHAVKEWKTTPMLKASLEQLLKNVIFSLPEPRGEGASSRKRRNQSRMETSDGEDVMVIEPDSNRGPGRQRQTRSLNFMNWRLNFYFYSSLFSFFPSLKVSCSFALFRDSICICIFQDDG